MKYRGVECIPNEIDTHSNTYYAFYLKKNYARYITHFYRCGKSLSAIPIPLYSLTPYNKPSQKNSKGDLDNVSILESVTTFPLFIKTHFIERAWMDIFRSN